MAQQAGERTEKATSRRRKQAKDKGQFPYSQELTSVITLSTCMTTVAYYLESPSGFRSFFATLLQQATTVDDSALIHHAGVYILTADTPVFIAAVVPDPAGHFLQDPLVFAPEQTG